MSNNSWNAIFERYDILNHNFDEKPFPLSASQIKTACHHFTKTSEKEVRILCKQDSREDVPTIMTENGLFLLPVKNGQYVIIKGEGYFDVTAPEHGDTSEPYESQLPFRLETSSVGNSEMQHVDKAYAVSMIRSFIGDPTLVLTIRGRKYTPTFSFKVNNQTVEVKGVQTEVDAGYEGENQIILLEAKNSQTNNTIIRQLFYPFKQWSSRTSKPVRLVFFEKRGNDYMFWQYEFTRPGDYNSIRQIKFKRYHIISES